MFNFKLRKLIIFTTEPVAEGDLLFTAAGGGHNAQIVAGLIQRDIRCTCYIGDDKTIKGNRFRAQVNGLIGFTAGGKVKGAGAIAGNGDIGCAAQRVVQIVDRNTVQIAVTGHIQCLQVGQRAQWG